MFEPSQVIFNYLFIFGLVLLSSWTQLERFQMIYYHNKAVPAAQVFVFCFGLADVSLAEYLFWDTSQLAQAISVCLLLTRPLVRVYTCSKCVLPLHLHHDGPPLTWPPVVPLPTPPPPSPPSPVVCWQPLEPTDNTIPFSFPPPIPTSIALSTCHRQAPAKLSSHCGDTGRELLLTDGPGKVMQRPPLLGYMPELGNSFIIYTLIYIIIARKQLL